MGCTQNLRDLCGKRNKEWRSRAKHVRIKGRQERDKAGRTKREILGVLKWKDETEKRVKGPS